MLTNKMHLIPSKVLCKKNMKTPSAACAPTALLWDNIVKDARTGILPKWTICLTTFSRNVSYECPCCEHAALRNNSKLGGRCKFCPMLDFWSLDFSKNKVNAACDRSGSPYNKWGIAAMRSSPKYGNFSYSFCRRKNVCKDGKKCSSRCIFLLGSNEGNECNLVVNGINPKQNTTEALWKE